MVKKIFETNSVPCKGEFKSVNHKLDFIAHRLFDKDKFKLFSKSRKHPLPLMKKEFIRYTIYNYNITQREVAEYLGYQDHSTINHHLNHD